MSHPSPTSIAWREKSFEILLNKEWLSGTFDRVVIENDDSGTAIRACVIDFKTDRVNSTEDLDTAGEKYRPQLDLYRQVLARMTGLPETAISTQLLFTRAAKLLEI